MSEHRLAVMSEEGQSQQLHFDISLKSEIPLLPLELNSIDELLFRKLEHRAESSSIIYSHIGSTFTDLTLPKLRKVILQLFDIIDLKSLKRGDTIALVRFDGCSELYTACIFLALVTKGIRVLLPMYLDFKNLCRWLEKCQCKAVIIPGTEIENLRGNFLERHQIKLLTEQVRKMNIHLWDTVNDFCLDRCLVNVISENQVVENIDPRKLIDLGQADDEVLIITTSGSTGVPDLVTYQQISFLYSCQSWQGAGLFNPELLGGKGFTPLFTHTMGIRQFFNALWTGQAICLINTSWFLEKPETVAYLLQCMQPNHITGGPSVFRMLLELMRNFPNLKESLRQCFKQFISSGAPFDFALSHSLKTTFNITMQNAFGTTETQQVLNTLLDHPICLEDLNDEYPMGSLLPGVEIGLKKMDPFDRFYQLHVKSPFAYYQILHEDHTAFQKRGDRFYNTGDIVCLQNGRLYYVGRGHQDFLNDGFGLKIPIPLVRKYYQEVLSPNVYGKFLSFEKTPGLGLVLFVDLAHAQKGIIQDKLILKKYAALISTVNHQLEQKLSSLEYQHFVIRQLAVINQSPPLTDKGNVSEFLINANFQSLIEIMQHYGIDDSRVIQIDKHSGSDHAFSHYLSPYVGQMMKVLGIDYVYHRAKKDTLYAYQMQKEVPVLDFVGGFGTNFIGHNNREIKISIRQFLETDEIPLSDQISVQRYPGLLARSLNDVISRQTGKSYRVQLASTGSEAVEIAIHHAYYELRHRIKKLRSEQFQVSRGLANNLFYDTWEKNIQKFEECRPVIISLKYSFHGCTALARSLQFEFGRREAFTGLLPVHTFFIDHKAKDWKNQIDHVYQESGIYLNKLVRRNSEWETEEFFFPTIVAAIAEPIQGEGGIHLIDPVVLTYLSQFEFPLILDEIQSGLGRSGNFITVPEVPADYYLFGKALGGNFTKISAVVIDETRFQIDFQPHFVSTFANAGLAAKVALKTLEIIDQQKLADKALHSGQFLLSQLQELKSKYPEIIYQVRGKGLIAGIEFTKFGKKASILLRSFCLAKRAGYLYAAYLLKEHNIRVFPSLSSPNTLRLEPSAYITEKEIISLKNSLDQLCDILDRRAFYSLLKPLMDGDPFEDHKDSGPRDGPIFSDIEDPAPNAIHVAFIGHFAYVTEELRGLVSDLIQASDTGLHILFNKMQELLELKPITIFSKNIFNNRIYFTFYALPANGATLEGMHLDGKRQKAVEKIQKCIEAAAGNGSRIVSLGGYNSILTNNGLSLVAPDNVKIISGNTLTVATGIRHVLMHIQHKTNFPASPNLVVVGAAGNIGSSVVDYFVTNPSGINKIILIGRNMKKLQSLLDSILAKNHRKGPLLKISTNMSDCKEGDVIIITTNTNVPILFPHHIARGREVIISDVSIPSGVSKEVRQMAGIEILPFASYVSLPEDPDLKISSHTPPGTSFCCAAEAMICALRANELQLKGPINQDEVITMMNMAEELGFYETIGPIKSFKANQPV